MLNRPIPKSSKVGVFGTIVIIIVAVLLPISKAQKMNKGNVPVTGRTDRATSGVRVRKVLVRGESAYAGVSETRLGMVSPDGRYFSFTDWRSNTGSSWLRIRDLQTGEIRDITKPPTDKDQSVWNSIWSPDGKQIAYKCTVRRLRPPPHDEIRIAGLDGSYYYEVRLGYSDIYVAVLDPETGRLLEAPTKLKLPYEGWNSAPAWSPDGQYIAYYSRRNFTRSDGYDFPPVLTIYSVNSGKVRELSPQPWLKLYYGPQLWVMDNFLPVEGK